MLHVEFNTLNRSQFNQLFEEEGLEFVNQEQLKKALEQSYCTVVLFYEETLIGMARVVGDGAITYFIKDVLISKKYRHKGYGTYLMREVLTYIMKHTPLGWQATVELMSSLHKENFYESLGFASRPNAVHGAGMGIVIKGLMTS